MNLRRYLSVLSVGVTLLALQTAHADTVETFSGTFASSGTFSGTITFGLVTVPNNQMGGASTITGYEVTADNFSATVRGNTYNFLNSFAVGGTNNSPYSEIFFGSNSSFFLLDLPGNTPLATLPTSVCTINAMCSGTDYLGNPDGPYASSLIAGAPNFVGSASLTPPATPEPSSLILLGTGLIGAAGMARRRIFGR